MKKARFVYITEVDISHDSGHGINEREFVKALRFTNRDEVICVLPYPKRPQVFFDAGIEYVLGHKGKASLYPLYLLSLAYRMLQLHKRYVIKAIITRIGELPIVHLILSHMLNVPLILKTFGPHILTKGARWQEKMLRLVLRPLYLANAKRAVATDEPSYIYAEHVRWLTGVSKDKMFIVPNGANTEFFRPSDRKKCRVELGLDRFEWIIGYIGALSDNRYVSYLIRSVSILNKNKQMDVGCVIIGDGSEQENLVKLSRDEDITERVIFTGSVPYEMVPKYMNALDIAVDLSAIQKNIDRRVLYASYSQKRAQYLACGLPVIAWDIIDNHFLVENNIGSLAKLFSIESLTERLQAMLSLESIERDAMRQRARKYSEEHLSYHKLAEQRLRLWRKAVEKVNLGTNAQYTKE